MVRKFIENKISNKSESGFKKAFNFPRCIEHVRAYNNYLIRILFIFPIPYCYDHEFWECICQLIDKVHNKEVDKLGKIKFKDISFSYNCFQDISSLQLIFTVVSDRTNISNFNFSKEKLEEIELDYGRHYGLKKRDRKYTDE